VTWVIEDGTDVSFYNGNIEWKIAEEDGVLTAWIRFGQRKEWVDPRRIENWVNSGDTKILRGPYWVYDERGGDLASEHIEGFKKAFVFDPKKTELPPVVDVELFPITLSELKKFLEWCEEWFGIAPIIYSASWVFSALGVVLPEWMKKYLFWITGYNNRGPDLYGPLAILDPVVVAWQQTDKWPAPWCEVGKADRNYLKELWRYVRMPDKVVNADGLILWMQENAFECEDVQPPLPPIVSGTFDLGSPLPEPLSQHRVSQDFNKRYAAYSGIGGHDGIDFGVLEGTPITAAHFGIVTVAGFGPERGASDPYGWHVRIEQMAKDWSGEVRKFTTIYAHLSVLNVRAGDIVSAGDQIALSGGDPSDPHSGNSDGQHLHFAVIDEGSYDRRETFLKFDFMNPWIWLNNWPTRPVSRRRVKSGTWLNVRNRQGVTGSVARFAMGPLTEFDVWLDTGGDWPWCAQDISRTAWNSIHGNWTEPVA